MTCALLLARLEQAELRLGRISAATQGDGVGALWRLPERARNADAVPDAFFVRRSNPCAVTLIYDVRHDVYVHAVPHCWLGGAAGVCP